METHDSAGIPIDDFVRVGKGIELLDDIWHFLLLKRKYYNSNNE